MGIFKNITDGKGVIMIIIERFMVAKKSGECEDEIVVTDDFVAVIDGLTSKSNFQLDQMTTGQLAAKLVKKTIEQYPRHITRQQAIEKLTEVIYNFYVDIDMVDQAFETTTERLSVCVIIFSAYHQEIWMIGDCQCLLDHKHYENPKKVDTITAEARSLFVASELKNGKTINDLMENDLSREYILPLIKRGAAYQNCHTDDQYSYAVIDGFRVDERDIKIIKTTNVKEIVLASDGYPMIFPTLSETENYLKQVLEDDPLCYKIFKSTKGLLKGNVSFDDRSYIRFQL